MNRKRNVERDLSIFIEEHFNGFEIVKNLMEMEKR